MSTSPDQRTDPTTPKITAAQHIHFTGIKGVGMTAAALCVQDLSIPISGSDEPDDFVTRDILMQRSITSSVGFDPRHIPPQTNLLVYTGAHQGLNNPQVVSARQRGIRVISHAQAVGELMQGKIGVSVCGVGGKTSISAMLANVLDYAGAKPSFLIGVGKILNLQVPGRMAAGDHFIAEADEYVVSPGVDNTPRFMHQTPQFIICTNILHDHPDVYPDLNSAKKAFAQFFATLPDQGLLVANGNSNAIRELDLSHQAVVYYGFTPEKNDWWVKETLMGEGKQLVTFANRSSEFRLSLSVPGEFNAANALAAYIIARRLSFPHDKIVEALQLFRGSMRRFEKKGEKNGILYFDDYAHHPSQILATLKAAKQWLPLYPLTVVFQPHTYSRTKALMEQFGKSFTYADEVIITDIYASRREQPDPNITGKIVAGIVSKYHKDVTYVRHQDLVDYLGQSLKPPRAVFTLGAGDIYTLYDRIL